jgi:hypothetical protein
MMRRSVVVQQHPNQRRLRWLVSVVSALAILVMGAFLGRHGSLYLYESLLTQNQTLQLAVDGQATELRELRQSQQNQETRADVHKEALDMVRAEFAEQQALISDLEQGVRFYRNLMAPGEQSDGLSVRSIDLVPGSLENQFLFRILVQQNARKHGLLTGTLNIDLIGTENGSTKTYNLASLSAELPAEDIKLRFKYFQAIDGELNIPEGFKPRRMVAFAKATKPKQVEVKNFPWTVQEKITHVGN